jgi:hypothetical protein
LVNDLLFAGLHWSGLVWSGLVCFVCQEESHLADVG